MFLSNKKTMIAIVTVSLAITGACEADNYYFRHRGSVVSKPGTASIQFASTGVRAGSKIAAQIETSISNGAWRLQQTPENPPLGLEVSSNEVHGTAPFVSVPTMISVAGYVTKGMQSASANETSLTIYPELALPGGPKDRFIVQAGVPVGAFPQLQPKGLVGKASYQLISDSTAVDVSAICPGLSFSESTGQIAGTPVNDCYSPVKIQVVDSFDGTSASTEVFSLVSALNVVGKPKPMLPGASYSFDLKTITFGGRSPYSYTLSNLPSGLTVDSRGLITGTVPAVVNPVTVYIQVKDESGQIANEAVPFEVAASNVLAVGNNGDGQLGNGTTKSQSLPKPVSGGKTYVKVAAGPYHACGIVDDGTVECWGRVPGYDYSTVPYPIRGIKGATDIAAGYTQTCVIANSAVLCWGSKGNNYEISRPVYEGATAVSVGMNHGCAIASRRVVVCWGNDSVLQTRGSGLQGATAIASGGDHSCAVIAGGVQCWGNGSQGQLGNGSNPSYSGPVQVVGLTSGVTALSVGDRHSCAIVSGGVMKCWGSNYNSQLGSSESGDSTVPRDVSITKSGGVTAISTGVYGSCAVISGVAMCWGGPYLNSSTFPEGVRRTGYSGAAIGNGFAFVY